MNKGKRWRYEWPFILLLNFFAIGILSRLAPETSKWDGWQVLQSEVFPFHPITAWNEQTVLVSTKRPIFFWLEFVFEREKMLGEMFFLKWRKLIDDFEKWTVILMVGDFEYIIDSWWRYDQLVIFQLPEAAKDAADDSEVEALAQHVWLQATKKPSHPSVLYRWSQMEWRGLRLVRRVESYFEHFPGQLHPNLCTGGQGWRFQPKKSSKDLSLPKLKDVKSKKSIFWTCHFFGFVWKASFCSLFQQHFLEEL